MIDTRRRTECSYNPYDMVLEEFRTARFPDRGKPAGNNTRIFRRGEHTLAVQLHSTDVVTFTRMDRDLTVITLNSGGWDTVTTKSRMNEWAPRVEVIQRNYIWYVQFLPWNDKRVFMFEDGFTYLVRGD